MIQYTDDLWDTLRAGPTMLGVRGHHLVHLLCMMYFIKLVS